jgi:hypothetical protein
MAVGIPAIYGIFTMGLFAGWNIAKTVYFYGVNIRLDLEHV